MVITDMIFWWYTRGWKMLISKLFSKLKDIISFFSITSLARTLFAPFRQISANEGGDSLDAKFRALIDRLVSRMVGAVARIGIMIFGIIASALDSVISLALIILWPLVLIIPIACVVLTVMGVTV